MFFLKPFQLEKSGDLEFLAVEFPSFSLYYTTRRGGYSRPPFNSLNLSFRVGDEPEAVIKNRKKLAGALGIPLDKFATLNQKHSSRIFKVTPGKAQSFISPETLGEADAFITDQCVALVLFYADCLPVYFLEPKAKVAGLVHAGWRGLEEKIIKKTVKAMVDEYGVRPENLFAWLGPSIGPCCYQVSPDFLSRFESYPEALKVSVDTQVFLDLKSIGHAQLVEAGLKKEAIETAPDCTSCQNDLFFSYRRENGRTGRQTAILVLKDQ